MAPSLDEKQFRLLIGMFEKADRSTIRQKE